MAFEHAAFIKPAVPFNREDSPAPMFRKTFTCHKIKKQAKLSVCALGFGYVYINGKKITEDLFTAPFGDYRKTLWYVEYDVTSLLQKGENVIAVICGNGWYNENMSTIWGQNKADWRDLPKVILELSIGKKIAVCTDASWKYSMKSPVVYNELRCGEHFDSRLYEEHWNALDYDDARWENVQVDSNPPAGVFRLCECEPIRECALYAPQKMYVVSENRVIFDFGQNLSGYIRLRTNQPAGDKILMRHVEEINEDLSLDYNNMDNPFFYQDTPFQENEFICCGREFVYTPTFTYHGFRFVEITGLKNPSLSNVTAVFVHQDIKRRSHFECSDDLLNWLFEAGVKATWSNLFYVPTDCPSREKHGWTNDAQASAEQMMTNFEIEKLFKKWFQDILDAMREDGALPGIVPTPEWGYEDYNGPVADGALFELPDVIYRYTGDDTLLKRAYPYFVRYLNHLKTVEDENGDMLYGLGDWAAPTDDKMNSVFPNRMLLIKFLRTKILAEEKLGLDTTESLIQLEKEINIAKAKYLTQDGKCTLNKQTAVAMMIYFGIYNELLPLKKQLLQLVEEADFHHDCGMLGIRYLYHALSRCDCSDVAFRIIMASGYPSYRLWKEHGATTMIELWNCEESQNHHMHSDVMTWMMKYILGIQQTEDSVGFAKVNLCPHFFESLNYAKGHIDTQSGIISIGWERRDSGVIVDVDVPSGMEVFYKGKHLGSGHHNFTEAGNQLQK